MEYLTKLEGPATGFWVREQTIDCLCKKKLYRIEKESGKIVYEKEILEKEGLARSLVADREQIFISDFCTLYVLNEKDCEVVGKWKVGEDLSSDICGLAVDDSSIYCSVRNGRLVVFDRNTFSKREYSVSGSSMWSLKVYEDSLLCGTVDGQLLLLDRETGAVQKRLILGKQNIRSLFVDGEVLYAAGQDKKLFQIDLPGFQIRKVQRNVHRKMFDCAGVCEEQLVTVSWPCSEIALWNQKTLEKGSEIHIPLRLSGEAYIEGDKLYISSRNIDGIGLIHLNQSSGEA